jgi:hypothetical protein
VHTRATVPTAVVSVPLYRQRRRAGTQETGTSDEVDSSRTCAQIRFEHVGTRRTSSDSAGRQIASPRFLLCRGNTSVDEKFAAVESVSNLKCVNVACCVSFSRFAGLGPRCGRTLRTRKALMCEPSAATDLLARDRRCGVHGRTVPADGSALGPDAGVGHPRHTNGTKAGPTAGCSVCALLFDRSGGGR